MAEEPGRADPSAGAPADPRIGRVLQERYRITGQIAEGGMGVVYRAERIGLGRVVAIKFLHAQMARDPQIKRRFEIEAQAMSRLSHPNCIGVLDFGVDDLPYVVIDYVEGAPLDAAVRAGPMPARRAIKIVRQILAALAHAHAHGIVHRDIKPENVVLEGTPGLEDHVRILDFGLAKLMGSDFGLTVGLAVGTPHYMAPEQMSERPVDGRADLYATGIVLYELLTGQKAFDGAEVGDVLLAHLGTPPPKLREVAAWGRFSAELEAVVVRAMAKKPEDRYASANAMMAALDEVPEALLTPGPEAVLTLQGRPASALGVDATVPWSSAEALSVVPTLGPEVPPAPPSAGPGSGPHGEGEPTWRLWLFERPFWLAVGAGLGAALLACAMVALGMGGRLLHPPAPPAPEAAAATSTGARSAGAAREIAAPVAPISRAASGEAARVRARSSGRREAALATATPVPVKSEATKSAATKSEATKSVATKSEASKPVASKPVAAKPPASKTREIARGHRGPPARARAAPVVEPPPSPPPPPKRKPFLKWL